MFSTSLPYTYLFTSESVTEGHPDKICDQISDAILDAFLAQDPKARVAAEVMATTGLVLVTGEVTANCYVDISSVVRHTIQDIGYIGEKAGGFDGKTCGVIVSIDEQSKDIAQGVDEAQEIRLQTQEDLYNQTGAGDQGMMFGYACRETENLMPLPIALSHRLARRLSEVRKSGLCSYLRPDGKVQVTVKYQEGQPVGIDTIVISTQHDPDIEGNTDNAALQARIREDLLTHVIGFVFQEMTIQPSAETRYFINPTGRFVVGGPQGDSGLTGRKIIVDTYGGYARHGGGAFSGKDPTKVDRSAAYATRWVAKNIVAAGLADRCEIQVSYAIGVAKPVSIFVDTFGTGKCHDRELAKLIAETFDLRPAAIIDQFKLTELPKLHGGRFYQNLAAYGHMGREDFDVPWERLDKVDALKRAFEQCQLQLAGV
ncbi:MAG: methionine adenosyltransferase [Vampirovibrionales bacterium]